MSLQFLCPNHRDWVYFHSEEALQYIENAQQKGELMYRQGKWREAIPFLGCAYEATEILLELHGKQHTFLLTQLTTLAIWLNECLIHLNAQPHTADISDRALQWLCAARDDSAQKDAHYEYLQMCIQAVQKCAAASHWLATNDSQSNRGVWH